MWKKVKNSWVVTILFALLGMWVAYGAYRMILQAVLLLGESRTVEKETAELEQKKKELEAYIAELKSRSAVEREAKERLNLKLPGEEVVVVLPEKKESATSAPSFFEGVKNFFR